MRNVLIIGWNSEAFNLFERISSYTALGFNVKGFISSGRLEPEQKYKTIPLLGDLISLASWIKFYNISGLLIALRPDQKKLIERLIGYCKNNRLDYLIVSELFQSLYSSVVQDVYKDIFRKRHFSFIRMLDILGALSLIVFFSPVFFIIVFFIKTASRGPLITSHPAIGNKGKIFPQYKFRTYILEDTGKKNIQGQSIKRKIPTKFGAILQISRVDELPQLINIVKGDMSFVGPRADTPFVFASLKEQIPLYEKRLAVRPGVFGWAQLKWEYDDTIQDIKEKLNYDLDYIKHRSFWFDVRIILKMMARLFRG